MNAAEIYAAGVAYTKAIGAQPLPGILFATALACDEAEGALVRAGNENDTLIQALGDLADLLRNEAAGVKIPPEAPKSHLAP